MKFKLFNAGLFLLLCVGAAAQQPSSKASSVDPFIGTDGMGPVSYTHLDVYKRQAPVHLRLLTSEEVKIGEVNLAVVPLRMASFPGGLLDCGIEQHGDVYKRQYIF